jgi:hypothetical protein
MSTTVALLVLLTSISFYIVALILMLVGIVTVYEDGSILVNLAGHQWGTAIPFTLAGQQ